MRRKQARTGFLETLRKKSHLLRPRHRWEDIKTDLQKNRVSVGVVDWTDLAQERDR
jgi:hypothetical protein